MVVVVVVGRNRCGRHLKSLVSFLAGQKPCADNYSKFLFIVKSLVFVYIVYIYLL